MPSMTRIYILLVVLALVVGGGMLYLKNHIPGKPAPATQTQAPAALQPVPGSDTAPPPVEPPVTGEATPPVAEPTPPATEPAPSGQ